MKVRFSLTDETTITNTTVKVTAWITGVVNGETREQIEARALATWKTLFPDVKQSFSNFTYQPDGLTFRVQVATRIDASENDQLDQRAITASNDTVRITNLQIDPSIPVHDLRKGESDLRVRMLSLAQDEAKKIGGVVSKVNFNPHSGSSIASQKMFNATYAMEAAGGAAPALGHSEKLSLTADVVVKVSDTSFATNG
jgi:hypothetical protein